MSVERIKSVDVCRLIAIFAVMAIHTQPFAPPVLGQHFQIGQTDWVINQLSRFAVPFFFVMAGYFWAIKQGTAASPAQASWKTARRIGFIFIAWSIIYLIPFDVISMCQLGLAGPVKLAYWNVVSLLADPLALLGRGTKLHLWFLVALLWCVALATLVNASKRPWLFVGIGVLLYLVALLGKAYALTPLGFASPIDLRHGPFFGTLLFGTGIVLSRTADRPDWLLKGLLAYTLGLVCQATEVYVLWGQYRTFPYPDFTVGTYFMGLGFSMAALSNHPWLQSERLSTVGSYTLGFYAIHFVFVDMFVGIGQYWVSPLREVGFLFAVFVFSVGIVLLMGRSTTLRKLVA